MRACSNFADQRLCKARLDVFLMQSEQDFFDLLAGVFRLFQTQKDIAQLLSLLISAIVIPLRPAHIEHAI